MSSQNTPKLQYVVEQVFRDMNTGALWIDILIDRVYYASLGPFSSEAERQKASDDFAECARSLGAKDVPNWKQ